MATFSLDELDTLVGTEDDAFGALFGNRGPMPKAAHPAGKASKLPVPSTSYPITPTPVTPVPEFLSDSIASPNVATPGKTSVRPGRRTPQPRPLSPPASSGAQEDDVRSTTSRDEVKSTTSSRVMQQPQPAATTTTTTAVALPAQRPPKAPQSVASSKGVGSSVAPDWLTDLEAETTTTTTTGQTTSTSGTTGTGLASSSAMPGVESVEGGPDFMEAPTSDFADGSKPQPKPQPSLKILQEQERDFHYLLEGLTKEISAQQTKNSSVKSDISNELKKLEASRREKQGKIDAEMERQRENKGEMVHYKERKIHEAQAQASEALAEVRTEFVAQEKERNSQIALGLEKEITDATREVEEALKLRSLLKMGVSKQRASSLLQKAKREGIYPSEEELLQMSEEDAANVDASAIEEMILSREGIFISVEDEIDVQAKMGLITKLITRFVKKARNYVSTKISSILQTESAEMVTKLWQERLQRKQLKHEEHRNCLQKHQKENAERFVEFVDKRRSHRQELKQNWLEQLTKGQEQFRALAAERLQKELSEVSVLQDQILSEAKEHYQTEMKFLDDKRKTLLCDDEQVFHQQEKDLSYRLEAQEKISVHLLHEELQTLKGRLKRELEIKSYHFDTSLAEMQNQTGCMSQVEESLRMIQSQIQDLHVSMSRKIHQEVGNHGTSPLDKRTATNLGETPRLIGSIRHLHRAVGEQQELLRKNQAQFTRQLIDLDAAFQNIAHSLQQGQLTIHSEFHEMERTKTHWEKELCLLMSRTVEPAGVNGGSSPGRLDEKGRLTSAGMPPSRVLFAGEEEMVNMIKAVADHLQYLRKNVEKQQKSVNEWHRRLQNDDYELETQQKAAGKLMESLFEAALKLPTVMNEVHGYEGKIVLESSKLEAEKHTLQHDQTQFQKNTKQLQEDSQKLTQVSQLVHDQYSRGMRELKKMEDRKQVLDTQQHQVVMQHHELRKSQDYVLKEQKRLDFMQLKLLEASTLHQVMGVATAHQQVTSISVTGGAMHHMSSSEMKRGAQTSIGETTVPLQEITDSELNVH